MFASSGPMAESYWRVVDIGLPASSCWLFLSLPILQCDKCGCRGEPVQKSSGSRHLCGHNLAGMPFSQVRPARLSLPGFQEFILNLKNQICSMGVWPMSSDNLSPVSGMACLCFTFAAGFQKPFLLYGGWASVCWNPWPKFGVFFGLLFLSYSGYWGSLVRVW